MSPTFRFKAKNYQGSTISSTLEAVNRAEALQQLQNRQLIPFRLDQCSRSLNNMLSLMQRLSARFICQPCRCRDLMIFCHQFSTMLQAGIPVLQCLNILSEQVEMTAIQKRVRYAAAAVEEGSSLSTALGGDQNGFPPILVHLVAVGETGGALDTVMDKMADHFERQLDLQEKIRSATLYPAFIISLAIVVMAVIVVFVLPQFAAIFNAVGMEMPLYTRILFSLGSLTRDNIIFLLGIFFVGLFSSLLYLRTKKGRLVYDLLRLRFPLFGKVYRQTLAARFARILGTLFAGGVSLHAALQLVEKALDNIIIAKTIREIGSAVNKGETIAEPLKHAAYFPPLLYEMVRIGEESGSLESTLHSTALFYEREVAYFVERLGTILEPILLLCIGLFIGLLVFSIFSPMYRIYEMI